jgi:hypothetical protein
LNTHSLPVNDYQQNHCTQMPIQRCPTGAIGWLDDKGQLIKGFAAKKSFASLLVQLANPK